MQVFTVKQIATICDIEAKNIHTYISRGKLIKRKDGLIDDTHPINLQFLQKYSPSEYPKPTQIYVEPEIKPIIVDVVEPIKKERTKRTKAVKESSENDYTHFNAANSLNALKAEKTKWEIEILKLKSKVQTGELIPISLAENITSVHFNSITSIFYNAIDNEISDICNDLGVDREKLSSVRGKLKHILNDCVSKSKDKSKKDLILASENYEEQEGEDE